jgi:cell division protein FtsL
MRRTDFILFICLILCALAVVHTQHRARRVFVDIEREKTIGDELAADLRRIQAERATLVASNRVERVASDMKMHLPDTRSVIVMGNQSQDLADIDRASKSLALATDISKSNLLVLPEPHAERMLSKQLSHSAKRGKQ